MSKILKNTTASPVDIPDVGQTVPASGQITIESSDDLLYKGSSDVVSLVGDGTLVVNDGTNDLSISDGIDLIKELFPSQIELSLSGVSSVGSLNNPITTRLPLPSTDAFGRVRNSAPSVIFETSFVENDRSEIYSNQVSNGGTLVRDSNKAHMELRTTTASGSSVVMQSKQRVKYTPGQSNLNVFVGIFDPKNNNTQGVGLHDGNDGYLFTSVNGDFGVSICNSYTGSTVTTRVVQSDFNLDKLDGTGVSGLTLDITKTNIYLVDFQWLGAGTVRWGVFIGGKIIYFHQTDHANSISTSKYTRTANLPVRAFSQNTGSTSSNSTFVFSCCSIISEGTKENSITQRSKARTSQRSVVANEFRPIISIRLKGSSQTSNIKPIAFKVQNVTADELLVELRLNPTLSNGTSWQDVDSQSVAQFDVGSNDVSGGIVLETLFLNEGANNRIELDNTLVRLGKNLQGVSDIISIAVISLTNNANCFGSITWEEEY